MFEPAYITTAMTSPCLGTMFLFMVGEKEGIPGLESLAVVGEPPAGRLAVRGQLCLCLPPQAARAWYPRYVTQHLTCLFANSTY